MPPRTNGTLTSVSAGIPYDTGRTGVEDHARQSMLAQWRERVFIPIDGFNIVEVVHSVLADWIERTHGSLAFRLVRVLLTHRCFGIYMCHIGSDAHDV